MAVNIFMDMPQGPKMPAIGLGTGQLRDESVVEETLTTAFDLGYRHLDTAYAYQNEDLIGRVLKKWISSGKIKREEIFITTKLPLPGIHEDRVEMFMKRSLENLQLDYVDLYLIHFPIGVKYIEGQQQGPGGNYEIDVFDHIKIWKKMEEQVDAGRAKNIGLSNFNQRQIEKILKSARIKPSCLQIEIHVDFQQRDLVDFCHKNGIVVVAYSPVGAPGPNIRREPRKVPVILYNETLKKIGEKYKKSSAQIMLRYLLQKNIVAIPKSSNPLRLKENIDVFDFKINSKDMETLDGLEAGEIARLGRFTFVKGIEDHPEYPFPKLRMLILWHGINKIHNEVISDFFYKLILNRWKNCY